MQNPRLKMNELLKWVSKNYSGITLVINQGMARLFSVAFSCELLIFFERADQTDL